MSSQAILLSTCDRCTQEARTPLVKKSRRVKYDLPQGWLHVSGNTATATVFEMDLCEECKKAVLEASGTFTHSRVTKLAAVKQKPGSQ
jgi:hypothetical protein